MDEMIELLKQIQELAGVAVDALQGGGHGGPPHEGGGGMHGGGHGGPPPEDGKPPEGGKPPEQPPGQ